MPQVFEKSPQNIMSEEQLTTSYPSIYYRTSDNSNISNKQNTTLTGQRFNRWTILERAGTDKRRNRQVLAKCDCGKEKVVYLHHIRHGASRSCGCLRREIVTERHSQAYTQTRRLRTVVDGFLGWTTEYLNFVPVGDTYALVDEEDFEKLHPIHWSLITTTAGKFYAQAFLKKNGLWKHTQMHHLLLPLPKGLEADHKNMNGLDNRRENLRPATRTQNRANTLKQKNKKLSRYKGVSKLKNLWVARVGKDNTAYYLGSFSTEQEAAKAYNAAAVQLYGEFARINRL